MAALISFELVGAWWLGYEWMGAKVNEDAWLVDEFDLTPLALPAIGASCQWLLSLG